MSRYFNATGIVMVLLSGLAPAALQAQASAVKVGFVDSAQVLYGTQEGQAGIEQLNTFMTQKQREIEQQGADVQRLQEQYNSQQRTLNPETRAEMERALQDRQRDLKRLQEDAQAEAGRRQNELLGKLSEKIQKIINDYAAQNQFDVIFIRDESQVFVAPQLDVTQAIIEIYNQQNPVAAPAQQPPAAAAPPPATPTPPQH